MNIKQKKIKIEPSKIGLQHIYTPLFIDAEVNDCFSLYLTSEQLAPKSYFLLWEMDKHMWEGTAVRQATKFECAKNTIQFSGI